MHLGFLDLALRALLVLTCLTCARWCPDEGCLLVLWVVHRILCRLPFSNLRGQPLHCLVT